MVALQHKVHAKYKIPNPKHIPRKYLKTLEKVGKSGERTKIDTIWERVPLIYNTFIEKVSPCT